jgi:CubicO group peptidase (beta-lactamase class C family)
MLRRIVFLAVSLAAFVYTGMVLAQDSNSPTAEDIEQQIQRVVNGLLPETAFTQQYAPKTTLKERMAYYHTPGVSIAVINHYKLEWARGFGVKEWGKPDAVTEATLFQAGSISKPIFALAVMRLVQDGKLDLDEDVNHYLSSWKVPSNGPWQPRITLRQLLSHSAGLTVSGFPGYLRTEQLPSVIDILNGHPPANTARVEVNILPGTQFRYSGGGTMVAQQVVMDVLGQPFPKIMRDLVLDPLGMTQSTYEQPLPDSWAGSAATAHPWKNLPVEGKWLVYPELAAAGLWTTPSDLARAGIELQLALQGESQRVLSAVSVAQMLTPGIDERIGIGFFLAGKGKTVRFRHDGGNAGFVGRMTVYKDIGMGMVIMLNSIEGIPMLDEIERAIAQEYEWSGYFPEEKVAMTVSPEILDAYVGEYVIRSGLQCVVIRENDRLFLKPTGQPAIELHGQSETRFFMTPLNTEVTFDKTERGEVKGLTLHQAGQQISAERKR